MCWRVALISPRRGIVPPRSTCLVFQKDDIGEKHRARWLSHEPARRQSRCSAAQAKTPIPHSRLVVPPRKKRATAIFDTLHAGVKTYSQKGRNIFYHPPEGAGRLRR